MNFNAFKKYATLIGNIGVLVSLGFISKIVYNNINKVAAIDLSYVTIILFVFLILLGIIAYLFFAYSWSLQLKKKYPRFNFITSFKIIALTQIAKYVPGNIGHFVGRFYLAHSLVKKTDVVFSILIENILFTIASLFLGAFYLMYSKIPEIFYIDDSLLLLLFLIVLFLVFVYFVKHYQVKLDLLHLSVKTLFLVFILLFCAEVIGGTTVYFLIKLLASDVSVSYVLCLSGFAVAFFIGYIVPGAPSGIGVREYVFIVLFSPFIGKVLATQVIIIYRLLSVASDVTLYFIGKNITNKHFDSLELEGG